MKDVDLNCDVAEGMGNEHLLMPFISSCNVACGTYAGDEDTMRKVIELAMENGISVGAHPGFNDRENFGRKEIQLSDNQLRTLFSSQIEKMLGICDEFNCEMYHVKPHGALYNLVAQSFEASSIIVDELSRIAPNVKLFGLANSQTEKAAANKVEFVTEGFIDRKYASNSKLMSRLCGGLITDVEELTKQLEMLLLNGQIQTLEGVQELNIRSLCLHGDTPGVEIMAAHISKLLSKWGIEIKAP